MPTNSLSFSRPRGYAITGTDTKDLAMGLSLLFTKLSEDGKLPEEAYDFFEKHPWMNNILGKVEEEIAQEVVNHADKKTRCRS